VRIRAVVGAVPEIKKKLLKHVRFLHKTDKQYHIVQCDIAIQISKEQYCAFCWTECCELVINSAWNEEYKI
jgi:hypothetical protein